MSSDRIIIRGLRVLAYCGVLEEEKNRRQPFEINAEVVADLATAGQSDELADTINYGELTAALAELAETGRFSLLEYFAQQVADTLLRAPQASEVTVEVLKLRPPVPEDLDCSGVRITRGQNAS